MPAGWGVPACLPACPGSLCSVTSSQDSRRSHNGHVDTSCSEAACVGDGHSKVIPRLASQFHCPRAATDTPLRPAMETMAFVASP